MESNNIFVVSSHIFNRDMCILSQREATFKNWSNIQKPKEMASCGFFYTGHKDNVYCFYCGIGLNNWLPTDSPWIEHALYSPKCTYFLLNKWKFSGHDKIVANDPFAHLLVICLNFYKNVLP